MRSIKNSFATTLFLAASLGHGAVAQSPKSAHAGGTSTTDASEAFGATYGTSNLARRPAVVPTTAKLAAQGFKLTPDDYLAAQNVRSQPPAQLKPYTAYLQNDALVADLKKMIQVNPNADPAELVLLGWNHVALDMTSIDHTTAGQKVIKNGVPTTVFEATYGEQFGPPRSSRALAMVHLAMFEAANAIDQKYHSYKAAGAATDLQSQILNGLTAAPTPDTASMSEAIMIAAHDTLVSLYPHKRPLIDVSMLIFSVQIAAQEQSHGASSAASRIALGVEVGKAAAAAVIATRASDQSDYKDPTSTCPNTPPDPAPGLPAPICFERFFPAVTPVVPPLTWTADIIVPNRLQLGANWKLVTPFVLTPHQFVQSGGLVIGGVVVAPPKQTDASFIQSYTEPTGYGPKIANTHVEGGDPIFSKYGVRAFGGFGPAPGAILEPPPGQGLRALTPSKRTPDETRYAQFWGYDATALLCAPPRLYNMIATSYILEADHANIAPKDVVGTARYLALVNLALADAGIEAWEGKFGYAIARPITYIRSQPNDPHHPEYDNWTPLGQVASNGAAANVTPPFPAYPSGHAVFGGAVFEMISKVLGVGLKENSGHFDFVSDEYNGQTYGLDGQLRPFHSEHYTSLYAAEWENAESRIWLGIHWQRDADDGTALGTEISDAIYAKAMAPN